MAGLVGEGGKQLVRQIEPTMSAHLQTLADLEKNTCMYLVVERAGPAQTEWILLSTGQGQIHRIGVSETNVELPTHSGLDASTLMTVFRRQKVTDELYRVIPRYFSDETLASMAPPMPAPVERPEHLETPPAQRRSTTALVYLLPVVVALVAWGGWVATRELDREDSGQDLRGIATASADPGGLSDRAAVRAVGRAAASERGCIPEGAVWRIALGTASTFDPARRTEPKQEGNRTTGHRAHTSTRPQARFPHAPDRLPRGDDPQAEPAEGGIAGRGEPSREIPRNPIRDRTR